MPYVNNIPTFLQVAVIVQCIPPSPLSPQKNSRICYWFIETFLRTRDKIATIMTRITLLYFIVFTLDAGLLARSQYPEGPATGHLDTGFFFSWFPCA